MVLAPTSPLVAGGPPADGGDQRVSAVASRAVASTTSRGSRRATTRCSVSDGTGRRPPLVRPPSRHEHRLDRRSRSTAASWRCTGPGGSTSGPRRRRPTSERPDPKATLPRPPRPGPDFHERCSLVGDHPVLQRTLGLVSTCEVDDLPRLATSQWLSATHHAGRRQDGLAGPPAPLQGRRRRASSPSPRPRTGATAASASATTSRFGVLDIDPDGTALKLDRFLWTLPRLLAVGEERRPGARRRPPRCAASASPSSATRRPCRRRTGSTARTSCASSGGRSTSPLLMTEDVTRGMRVEVWDATTPRLVHAPRAAPSTSTPSSTARSWTTPRTRASSRARPPPRPRTSTTARSTCTRRCSAGRGGACRAPRPGKRVRHEDGDEIVEDAGRRPRPGAPAPLIQPRSSRHAAPAALRALVRVPGLGGRPGRQQPPPRARTRPAAPVVGRGRRQLRRSAG